MAKNPWDAYDAEEEVSALDAFLNFTKKYRGAFAGGTMGVILVAVLIYAVTLKPENSNFSNTQEMFSECVPVNGRCP